MRLKKSEFKKIVKECLMEILVEGFGDELPKLTEARKTKTRKAPTRQRVRKAAVQKQTIQQDNVHQQRIMESVNNITTDPVMASIFAETAATTLQEQRERPGMIAQQGGDEASKLVSQLDPVELAGSSKWADLAFAPSKKL